MSAAEGMLTLLVSQPLMIDLDAPFAGYEQVAEWYVSELTDHIYPTCPGLRRSDRPLQRGQGRLYPEAGDVCGWCVRVWRSRKLAP